MAGRRGLLHDARELLLLLDLGGRVVPQAFDEVDVLLLLIVSQLCIVDVLGFILGAVDDFVPLEVNTEVVFMDGRNFNVLLLQLF